MEQMIIGLHNVNGTLYNPAKGIPFLLNFDYSSVVLSIGKGIPSDDSQDGDSIAEVQDSAVLPFVGYEDASSFDLMRTWYGSGDGSMRNNTEGDELYTEAQKNISDVRRDMLTESEAEEAFKDIQYATVVGAYTNVGVETRRRFSLHILFNPASRLLFEALHGITRDVDYSRAV